MSSLRRAGEAQQRQEFLAVARILGDAFLQHGAELLPEGLVLRRLVLRQSCEHVEDALGEAALDGLDLLILLQQLARNVERQVGGVDHALDESQVQRQKLLGVVHDEDALDVELKAARGIALHEVERRARGDEQQARVLALALDAVVAPSERRGEVVRDVLIELAVLLVGDLGPGPRPQRLRLIA